METSFLNLVSLFIATPSILEDTVVLVGLLRLQNCPYCCAVQPLRMISMSLFTRA